MVKHLETVKRVRVCTPILVEIKNQFGSISFRLTFTNDNGVLRDKLITVEGQLGVMSSEIENYKTQISHLEEVKSSLGRENDLKRALDKFVAHLNDYICLSI